MAWLLNPLELPTLKAVDINPFTPLLYVFTLCFISSPMGELSNEFMTQEQLKLEVIFKWCQACEWSVTDFHFLFSRIYNVIHYRRLWTDADTSEGTALAAWSRDDAIRDLHDFMKARCLPDEIRLAVIWLYNHP